MQESNDKLDLDYIISETEQINEKHKILRKVIFRLVKGKISGTTLDSAIKVIRDLSSKGINASVTILNEKVDDTTKARYNTNSYIQLVKQLSRLNLKADISLRPSQLGYFLNTKLFEKNITELSDTLKKLDYGLWVEQEKNIDTYSIIENFGFDKMGTEATYKQINSKIFDSKINNSRVKIIPDSFAYGAGESGQDLAISKKIELIKNTSILASKVYLLEPDEKSILYMQKMQKEVSKNIIFEMPYGIGNKKINKLLKANLNMSIYLPYGKDWSKYAINRLTEGRIRRIAVAVLDRWQGTKITK
ncbi:MAG: hypothetical protein ACP5LP_03445 [Candidatus Micrarchaeia archaeon]